MCRVYKEYRTFFTTILIVLIMLSCSKPSQLELIRAKYGCPESVPICVCDPTFEGCQAENQRNRFFDRPDNEGINLTFSASGDQQGLEKITMKEVTSGTMAGEEYQFEVNRVPINERQTGQSKRTAAPATNIVYHEADKFCLDNYGEDASLIQLYVFEESLRQGVIKGHKLISKEFVRLPDEEEWEFIREKDEPNFDFASGNTTILIFDWQTGEYTTASKSKYGNEITFRCMRMVYYAMYSVGKTFIYILFQFTGF